VGPANFKIPEFGSYFNSDAFESTFEKESTSQYASGSAPSTSYKTPPAEIEPEFEEPKKIPEIEVYYKPLPQEPETTTDKAAETEFTPGPVYYKPLPTEDLDQTDRVRNFLKKKDDFSRTKPERPALFRTKLDGFSRPRLDAPSARTTQQQPEAPKRKSSSPDFFSGFDDRNADFDNFNSDAWGMFDQDWGQKVSR
jgi:hypothetical protein